MYTGPNIERDGLVFGYDTGANPSSNFDHRVTSRRYFKGRPTENLITNPLPTSTSGFTPNGGTGTVSYDEELKAIKWEQTAYATWGTYFNFHPSFTGTLDTNSQYTFSLEYKSENEFADSLIYHQVVQGSGQSPATTNPNITSNTYGEIDGWKQYRVTFTPANTGVGSAFNRFITGNRGADVLRMWFRNIQFEKNNHKTPFTTGTRSATQSLIDLTRTTTIDVSNVSFGSDGLPTFDGTDDRVYIPNSTFTSPTELTIESVFKRTSTLPDVIGCPIHRNDGSNGNVGNSEFTIAVHRDNSYYIYGAIGANTGTATWANGLTGVICEPDTYYHVASTWDGTNVRTYVNGDLKVTYSLATYSNSGGNIRFGTSADNGGTYRWIGELPINKIYNRALSAQEVQQNYNAYKNRFNI